MPTLSMLPNTYPDPNYTIRKIRRVTRYIDHHGSVRIDKIPVSLINNLLLRSLRNCECFSNDDVFNSLDSSLFFCFSVFHHIYLNQYREYDFASLDNCQTAFIDFQRYLWEIVTAYKRHGSWVRDKLPALKLFDLKNTTDNIDAVVRWKRENDMG